MNQIKYLSKLIVLINLLYFQPLFKIHMSFEYEYIISTEIQFLQLCEKLIYSTNENVILIRGHKHF